MTTKICTKCKIEKTVDDFHNRSGTKNGKKPRCKQCSTTERKEHYEKNRKKTLEQNKKYLETNKDKRRKWYREYQSIKYKTDTAYRMTKICRSLTYRALKGLGNKHTMEVIGCSTEELWQHLEKQFTDGMTRENHGEWHIDHIKPLASASNQEEAERLSHYTNLQPLWAKDNFKKGHKL
jgi:hypothetical protein